MNKAVTITENRAPTDESIRLLNEFEKKAKDNLIAKIEVKENFISGVSLLFCESVGDQENSTRVLYFHYAFKFTLNSKEYTAEKKIREFDIVEGCYYFGSPDIFEFVKAFLSKTIANIFIESNKEEMWRSHFNIIKKFQI